MRLDELRFLIAASVLHTAIPVAAEMAPERDFLGWLLAAQARDAPAEIDVDVLDYPQDMREPDSALPYAHPDAIAFRERRDLRRDLQMPPATTPTADPESEPPPGVDPGPTLMSTEPGPSEYSMPPSRAEIDGPGSALPPGVGGPELWRRYPGAIPSPDRGLPAPTTTPRRKHDPERATRLIQDGQRSHDRALGLDFPGGATVKRVVQNAVLGSEVPFPSGAAFSIAVNKQGRVTAVNLTGHSGGTSADWGAVRKNVMAQLASTTFALKSSFAKGATLSVNVNAAMKTVGGGTSRDGATVSFDVTDIGARPKRYVAVTVAAVPVR